MPFAAWDLENVPRPPSPKMAMDKLIRLLINWIFVIWPPRKKKEKRMKKHKKMFLCLAVVVLALFGERATYAFYVGDKNEEMEKLCDLVFSLCYYLLLHKTHLCSLWQEEEENGKLKAWQRTVNPKVNLKKFPKMFFIWMFQSARKKTHHLNTYFSGRRWRKSQLKKNNNNK